MIGCKPSLFLMDTVFLFSGFSTPGALSRGHLCIPSALEGLWVELLLATSSGNLEASVLGLAWPSPGLSFCSAQSFWKTCDRPCILFFPADRRGGACFPPQELFLCLVMAIMVTAGSSSSLSFRRCSRIYFCFKNKIY